ncbi:N-acetylmuramic acid-6-phosphate etherase [Jeotgalibacillus malaysiensis]|uniref:N-acetylmuramic acid 6-phosphate etherase n=1 Tax=Jeotgalibacillus malaysiensis TaxID=1508404 RepID=A0A0B5AV24_9BACL|nr:N-acetylmuramic acid 6-phosphate etherase [Jeotgalibacillus malaysiensis]AJD92592.1 N-acetylmuramic acid-6-phosphate etherase [Jeotgalibacillus malaysiensis]
MTSDLTSLITEQRNPNSMNLDQLSVEECLKVMNAEDQKVAEAVKEALPAITEATTRISQKLKEGGRLFYIGAGTSGRLGYLDASECPPTFMTPPEMVQAIMAGGMEAFGKAKENAEDSESQGAADLKHESLTAKDTVIGIAASGRTPYVAGALKYAGSIGAYTVALSSNRKAEISQFAETAIEVVTGPEVLTGSTRMKAATGHKMVLNMISTAAMVQLGKVQENLMIDVHASNYKLMERAKRIIMDLTGTTYEHAAETLEAAHLKVKHSIVMIEAGVSFEKADHYITLASGYAREAVRLAKQDKAG